MPSQVSASQSGQAEAEQATRSRLLRITSKLLQTQGYHGTGLNQILKESQAPRGSLYFHFPGGKEQLAVEALETSAAWVTRAMRGTLESSGDDTRAGLRAIAEIFAVQLERSNFAEGCPFATVALESSSLPDSLRRTCGAAFGDWQALLAGHLARVESDQSRAASLATLVLVAIEGAMVLAKARRDAAPLRQIGAVFDSLFPD